MGFWNLWVVWKELASCCNIWCFFMGWVVGFNVVTFTSEKFSGGRI